MTGSSNAQQIEYWNGPVGARWARLQERIDLQLAQITQAALNFAEPREGEHILDIGCGCGTATLLLALRAGDEGTAAGIDISSPMLGVARARAMAQNAGVIFIEADASIYEFQPVFDLVFSRFGLYVLRRARERVRQHRTCAGPGWAARLRVLAWPV